MSHMTEEQFEDILQGQAEIPEHISQCPKCRDRLEEKRALAHRMYKAFAAIHVPSGLAKRMRVQIAAAQPVKARPRIIPLHRRSQVWSALAIAAILLIVVILRSSHVDPSSRVRAAQTALVNIHRVNLASLDRFVDGGDHPPSCKCMKSRSGSGVTMPCCQRGLCLRGCQERQFQGRLVECCVIRQPNGSAISVVVIPESPEALGMTRAAKTIVTGQVVWQASYGPWKMASIRMGEESCCVIGLVPPEDLVAVLNAFEQ